MKNINFYDAIRKRRSVRTYKDEPLTQTDLDMVKSLIDDAESLAKPFETRMTLHLINNKENETSKQNIGTYGFVKNAPHFIAGVTQNDSSALVDFGYGFEMLILALAEHGLGTVWLGGTFKRKQFQDILKESETDAFIPAVTPVGYPALKRSLRERTIRKAADADNRQPFETLFWDAYENMPLKRKDNPRIAKIFDFVRKAPSASNKQPWRLYWQGDVIHVALHFDEKYNNRLNYPIQMLDAGIAMAHLEIGLDAMNYTFKRFEGKFKPAESERYVISYKIRPGK